MVEEAANKPDIVGEEYASSLADLTVNSKPLINMLTMLAEENIDSAASIVKVIENHLSQVKPEMKLPVLYLVDSIVKNIGAAYTTLFTQNIVNTFCSVFEKVDESTRASMFKLRQTWVDVFPPKKLYALDVRVKAIDPAWPITAPPPSSIHVNPAFIPKGESAPAPKQKPPPAAEIDEGEMRESLLKKQQELLELQRKKKEIEQLQEKAKLQQQQIQQIQSLQPAEAKPEVPKPVEASADICEPEPMEISQTPPPETSIEIITPASPGLRTPPEKKADKRDREKNRERKDSGKKRSRKELEDPRQRRDASRKGKEAHEPARADDEVTVVGERNLRDAAKSMPRIPKLSQQRDSSTAAGAGPRDPRLSMQKHGHAERRKMEAPKKDAVTEPKKRRTNRFDDLFGNEDIDLRKAPPPPVNPTPGVAVPQQLGSASPPRGWGGKRGAAPPAGRGRGAWSGRGGRPRGPQDEDSQDGSGSPRNMDFIVEQAKENHRNGVITDGEYSTIIRQCFQMSESKMIRDAQRSFAGPPDVDFRYHGPPEGYQEPGWNDPRRGFGPYPRRFDQMQRPGPPGKVPFAPAFEVRPDDDMKTIPIDNVPREIRFYGDQAVILMADDDPRSLGFAPGVRRVFIDNMTLDLTIGSEYFDFFFDGQNHRIKIGAPTRELYIDGNWYECMFGGPPITINFTGRPVQVSLEGPPPTVKFGTERRLDLLAGRVSMIIDAHSVLPVYLDVKLQHFDLGGRVFTLQFQDSLRVVVIDGQSYPVNFGGLPMPVSLDGRQHFVRFSSLPRGVEPGKVLLPHVLEASRKEEETKVPSALDIGELLSKLVATGLLPGAVPEAAKQTVKEEPKKEEAVIKPVNLSDSESMKVRNTGLISFLYSGMQCGSCGLRFPADQTVRYSTHLDWHFRQNRREKGAAKRPQSRKWYSSVSDWIQFEETEASDEKRINWFEAQAKEKSEKEGDRSSTPDECPSVAVGTSPEDNKCFVCHEDLDQFYHEENEEWHLRNAVRVDGITFHHSCYQDHSKKMDSAAYSPSDAYLNNDSDSEPEESEVERTASEDDRVTSADEDQKQVEKALKIDMFDSENSVSLDAVKKDENSPDAIDQDSRPPGIEEANAEEAEEEIPIAPVKEEKQFSDEDMAESEAPIEKPDELAEATSMEEEKEVKEEPKEELKEVPTEEPTEEPKEELVEEPMEERKEELKDVAFTELSETNVDTDTNSNVTIPSKEEEKQKDAFIPDIEFNVNETPGLVTTLDGNVEMVVKQEPTTVTAGFKIKINLFNKAPVVGKAQNEEPAPQTQPETPSTNSVADNVIPPPDDVALTNKPRLVGRKLTVLPPMKKGQETSGLCSIM